MRMKHRQSNQRGEPNAHQGHHEYWLCGSPAEQL
jgi:hypothetical protein